MLDAAPRVSAEMDLIERVYGVDGYEYEALRICHQGTDQWHEGRKGRLTASNMSRLCRIPAYRSRATFLRYLLSPSSNIDHIPAIRMGREAEPYMRAYASYCHGSEFKETGLWICDANPFLGASPDGYCDKTGCILECKMLSASAGMPLMEYARTNPRGPLMMDTEMNCLTIRKAMVGTCSITSSSEYIRQRTHNFYYQIQLQMMCTNTRQCLFIITTLPQIPSQTLTEDQLACVHMEYIYYDERFISHMMDHVNSFCRYVLCPYISKCTRKEDLCDPENFDKIADYGIQRVKEGSV